MRGRREPQVSMLACNHGLDPRFPSNVGVHILVHLTRMAASVPPARPAYW